MQVLFLKDHLYASGLQIANSLQCVHRIPGKAGNRLSKDQVYFTVHGFLDHQVKAITFFGVRAGDTFVSKHRHKLPIRVALNVVSVEVHLCFIAGLLLVLLRGDTGIGGNPQLFNGSRCS